MDREDRILRELSELAPTTIVAGHYCMNPELSELSHTGESEVASFRFGARLHARVRAAQCSSNLVLWVNDIGSAQAERDAMKRGRELPAGYRDILNEVGIAVSDVEVLFETTIRNRASVLTRKLARHCPETFQVVSSDNPGLVRCVEPHMCSEAETSPRRAYTLTGPYGERLVVKDGPNPKCSLILAVLFRRLERAHPGHRVVNMFNAVYRARIALGIHVGRVLFNSRQQYTNLFFDGPQKLVVDSEDVRPVEPPPGRAAPGGGARDENSIACWTATTVGSRAR